LGEHLRQLLRGGVDGWRLHDLPVTQTPLNDAEPLLGPRVYAMLARYGFTTVEEIAAVPDLGLLDIRHFGPKTVWTSALRGTPLGRPAVAAGRGRSSNINTAHTDALLRRSRASFADARSSSVPACRRATRPLVISIVARFVARSEVNATVPDEVSETGDVHGWTPRASGSR
jgi:hypothetical protein